MKKGLLSLFMVALMLVTVLSAGFSANAITIKRGVFEEEDTTGLVKITAECHDVFNYPNMPSAIPFAKVKLKSVNGLIHRVKFTDFHGTCNFYGIPENFELTVDAEHWRYDQISVKWYSKTLVRMFMELKDNIPRTVDNPLLEQFPLLERLFYLIK